MKKFSRHLLEVAVIVLQILFDRFTKIRAQQFLRGTDGIELIKGVLKLYYLPNGNTGAAFGMFKGQLWLFVFVTVLVCAVLFYILIKLPYVKPYRILHIILCCIIAGGIGNLIDRLMNGSVVDFIYFYLINFPIFNVADCYVTVSTVILAILMLFVYREADFKALEELLVPERFKKGKK